MANDDKPLKGRVGDAPRAAAKSAPERPFDMWLHKQLHAMYDEVAAEPLPEDLLNLIERDEKQEKPTEPSTKK